MIEVLRVDTDPEFGASFDLGRSASWRAGMARSTGARTPALLGTLLSARSEVGPGCGVAEAWRGRAGQAFELGEPGVVDGTTANSLAADRRGPRQDDQAAKTKLLAGSCLRIWTRAWGQREPADEEPAA